jgi:putative FmdB family regulatory protein
MPIFDYKCESCEKVFEVLQNNSNPFLICSDVNQSCKKESRINKLISNFAFSGFSTINEISQPIINNIEQKKSGCACHGTATCSGTSIRSKYGID